MDHFIANTMIVFVARFIYNITRHVNENIGQQLQVFRSCVI